MHIRLEHASIQSATVYLLWPTNITFKPLYVYSKQCVIGAVQNVFQRFAIKKVSMDKILTLYNR